MRYERNYGSIILYILILQISLSVYAQTPKVNISAGILKNTGNTSYLIGYSSIKSEMNTEDGFPISKLKFPVENLSSSLNALVSYKKWNLFVDFRKSISDHSGIMKDTDWTYDSDFEEGRYVSVYSEHDAEIKSRYFDVKLGYEVIKLWKLSIYGNLGYFNEKLEYTTNNLFQANRYKFELQSDDPYGDYRTKLGSLIDYDVTYKSVYFGLGLGLRINENVLLECGYSYSPFVEAEDFDNHIERKITMKGDSDGNLTRASVYSKIKLSKRFNLGLRYNYSLISTDGFQVKSYEENNNTRKLDNKIEMEQNSFMISIGYNI